VNGLVHVEVDAPHAKVTLNGTGQRDLSLGGLVDAIDKELARTSQALTPPQDFGRQLLRAYNTEMVLRGLKPGSQVTTLDLLPHVLLQRQTSRFLTDPKSEQFCPYPLTSFRADLFSLLKAGGTVFENAEFHWASGSNTKGAVFMLVPGLGRPAHVGRIWFTQKEESSHD
jgi:hypothetical protein